MVGVPGRSKGCNTCRKRRVKCDEGKPTCQRCARAGFECRGYVRETLWRHTSTVPFPAGESRGTVSALDTLQGGMQAQMRKFSTTRWRRMLASAPAAPNELSLVAFKGDMSVAYMFSNFVWKAFGTPWLDLAAEGKLGALAHDATTALAQAHFGRVHKQVDIELSGAAQYGKCLRTLAVSLGDTMALVSGKSGQDLVIPILILMLHASSHGDRTGSVLHLKGIAKLLFLCGPEAFQRQPLLNAFEAARATLVVASLISRQRLFLEDSRWQSLPWALDPAAKSPQSQLLDILVCVPGMLEDHSRLDESSNPTSSTPSTPRPAHPATAAPPTADSRSLPIDPTLLHDSILARIETKLETLYIWRWRWQEAHGLEVLSAEMGMIFHANGNVAETLGSIGPPRQLDRLSFSRAGAASEIMLYNAVLMWLLALLWKLEPLRAGEIIERCAQQAMQAVTLDAAEVLDVDEHMTNSLPQPPHTLSRFTTFEPLRRPGASVSIRDPAMEICRAFEWQSRNHGSTAGSNTRDQTMLYLFPVGMAMSVLDDESEGRRWIQELLGASPVTAGYAGAGMKPPIPPNEPPSSRLSTTWSDIPQRESSVSSDGLGGTENVDVRTSSRGMTPSRNVADFGFYVTKAALHPDTVKPEENYTMYTAQEHREMQKLVSAEG